MNKVVDYLIRKRGLTEETIKAFRIGSNSLAEVVIPLIDGNGRVVAFSRRRFEGKPKYINSRNDEVFEKTSYLFNLNMAKDKLDENILYAVEGYFCCMSLQQDGLPAIAYNGISFSSEQIKNIAIFLKMFPNLTLIWIPDNDGKAYKMIPRTREKFLQIAPLLTVKIGYLPDGVKDVNDLYTSGQDVSTLQQRSLATAALLVLLDQCKSRDAEQKAVTQFMSTVKSPLEREEIAQILVQRWSFEKKAVMEFLLIKDDEMDLLNDLKDTDTCLSETKQLLNSERLLSGFKCLDNNINYYGRIQDVTFIGGNSGSGKTMLICQIALYVTVILKQPAIFFSMEMSAGALFERIISMVLRKPIKVVSALIKNSDQRVLKIKELIEQRLIVVDKSNLSPEQIKKYINLANTRRLEMPCKAIFIDYLQTMAGMDDFPTFSRHTRELKTIAKEFEVHVFCLSQYNRSVQPWERPSVSSLNGGNPIEATGDAVLLLYRPGLDPEMDAEEREYCKNELKVLVGKARHGFKLEESTLVFDEKEHIYKESNI